MTENEEECAGCRVWTGGLLERLLMDFRGRRLCGWCVINWQHREELAGRALLFEEFTGGKLNKE